MNWAEIIVQFKQLSILGFAKFKAGVENIFFHNRSNQKILLKIALNVFVLTLILMILFNYPSVFSKMALKIASKERNYADSTALASFESNLNKSISALNNKLSARIPKNHYMVINTASNEFALYKGNELIKADKCSTGSYILLKKGNKQEWMFKTPKGEFKIRGKTKEPVWKKPDWAFVEEGLPVPSPNHSSRFEYGVLGDYSLNLGDGYLIHGTLFQRFLGLPVTHGCIRLNDENLALVYKNMSIGSKVFIY